MCNIYDDSTMAHGTGRFRRRHGGPVGKDIVSNHAGSCIIGSPCGVGSKRPDIHITAAIVNDKAGSNASECVAFGVLQELALRFPEFPFVKIKFHPGYR